MSTGLEDAYKVFTVCNLAYIPKALVLAESLLRNDNNRLSIFIFDRKSDVNLPSGIADYYWIEDLGVPDIYQLAFKYDITEFSTSLKPYIALHLLAESAKVIFLDPDTCVYNSLCPILDDLNNYPIVLTPHYTRPHSEDYADSDIGMMRFGSFNLGFFAVSRTDEAFDFLRWWNDRCLKFCYFETQFGLSTDQKWVSIAPCFFPNLHVSFNLGYNVAMWNAQDREIAVNDNGSYQVNGKFPLIFFHFSSYDDQNPALLSKRPFPEKGKTRDDLIEISLAYSALLKSRVVDASKAKYGFDYMSDGTYISPTLRRAYACVLNDLPLGHDPFDAKGAVGLFARKNFLLEKNDESFVSNSFGDVSRHKNKFVIVNYVMRLILRSIGPNRFANFSRLLVFLSSYRQNRDLWKL